MALNIYDVTHITSMYMYVYFIYVYENNVAINFIFNLRSHIFIMLRFFLQIFEGNVGPKLISVEFCIQSLIIIYFMYI